MTPTQAPKPLLKYAMIGGGSGSFIGAVHRRAIALDGQAVFAAAALSSTPDKSLASARELGLPADRSYPTWQALIEQESRRDKADRLDFITIVTPNHAHYDPALAALKAGFHVVCDKPLTLTSKQAQTLIATAATHNRLLAVTYNYTGYPMVRRAAELVRSGALGTLRKVFVEYHQGWLATPLAEAGQKQAAWRAVPALAGAGALGDIGTHAENLLHAVTGLDIESLCADVSSIVPGRQVDDDAAVLLRFSSGARGVLSCSQVCVGCENSLSIRVYGTEGSLSWKQENPNSLEFARRDASLQIITRGGSDAGAGEAVTRLPSGHPEGFHEAFANVYLGAFAAMRGESSAAYPTGEDGLRGVRFIEACLASGRQGGQWVRMEPPKTKEP